MEGLFNFIRKLILRICILKKSYHYCLIDHVVKLHLSKKNKLQEIVPLFWFVKSFFTIILI